MRFFQWIRNNLLFVFTLFLLAFIPLYPKLPLVDVKNTWVYVRVEDFLVIFVLALWVFLLIRKKITLRTPLTMPILFYWIIGALATIHGVLLIFPTIAGVFPNVAFLSFLRRIEYLSVFFVAYSGIKEKRFVLYTVLVLVVTLLLVVGYGLGQRYMGFPAFLTMNEEFAKGEAIRLSALSRVPSTFAGHYDLAAYLVLIIPILSSMIFGFRRLFVKAILSVSVILGIILLFMTVSRVSFVVLFVALAIVLFFQKKKLAVVAIIALAFLAPIFIMKFTPALLQRFGDTVKEVDVLVDAGTGEVIGHASVVPAKHFDNKIIVRRTFQGASAVTSDATLKSNELETSLPSAFFPRKYVPSQATLVVPPNASTGEDLPQGTAYINLSLSPVIRRVADFFYENPSAKQSTSSAMSFAFHGNFLLKRASAYDLSFTTRFQGEWPHAVAAFTRNIFLGSGYSSISLAVDNDYLRLLGETGLLGFVAFLAIFITIWIYILRILPSVDSPSIRSFVLGFAAGVVGLLLNGFLIDVFEASKVAFVLWLLAGVTLGLLALYQTKHISLHKELLRVATSTYAIVIYLFVVMVVVYSPMLHNYFVGDDYTWFRWAAECGIKNLQLAWCSSPFATIAHFFTQADGFFYRPGTKTYFYLMFPLFWLNQNVYHVVSLLLHFLVAVCFFFLAKKLLNDKLMAALVSFLFLIMSGHVEIVFWISSTGHLFSAFFVLLSLLFFIQWDERRRSIYFITSLLSMVVSLLFYEAGVVVPLFIILYKFVQDDAFSLKKMIKIPQYLLTFVPIILYGLIRYSANSHWSGGDYSYNLLKLPFNFVGNAVGYIFLTYIGTISLPYYEVLRNLGKTNIFFALIGIIVLLFVGVVFYKKILGKMDREDKKIVIFGALFFLIALLPFLGFGNISPRYNYLASFGLIIIFVYSLKKIYLFLTAYGKDVALASATVIISAFCLLHIIQMQQIHSDWHEAGEKVQRFFVSIDGAYSDYWSTEPMKFDLINVPVREGQAWVFPVGLPDAIWFIFRNPEIQIYTWHSANDVFSSIKSSSKNEKVFEFKDSGEVVERSSLLDKQ